MVKSLHWSIKSALTFSNPPSRLISLQNDSSVNSPVAFWLGWMCTTSKSLRVNMMSSLQYNTFKFTPTFNRHLRVPMSTVTSPIIIHFPSGSALFNFAYTDRITHKRTVESDGFFWCKSENKVLNVFSICLYPKTHLNNSIDFCIILLKSGVCEVYLDLSR